MTFEYKLLHDWPLRERSRALELGCLIECRGSSLAELAATQLLGRSSAGWWDCDLADNRLTWTSGVYGIFGVPGGVRITRDEALALYSEESRAKLERLRAKAIDSLSAFAIDAQIRPASGEPGRWMRIIGAPMLDDGATRLQGIKLLI